jgi:hypothetical protein
MPGQSLPLQSTLLCLCSEDHPKLLDVRAPRLPAGVRTAYNSAHLALKASRWSGTMRTLKAGDVAPDFEVPAVLGENKTRFRLSSFRGRRNVVLAFYALDWTPT